MRQWELLRVRHECCQRTATAAASRRGRARALIMVVLVSIAGLAGFLSSYHLWQAPGTPGREPPSNVPLAPHSGNTTAAVNSEYSPEELSSATADELPPVSALRPDTSKSVIDEASRVVQHLVQRFPDSADAHEVNGRFHFWMEDMPAAAKYWQKCLDLDPSYAHAYRGLGSVAAKQGNHEEAITFYRKALLFNPGNLPSRLELAESLVATQEFGEAVAVLKEGVEMHPNFTDGFVQLGHAYLQLERLELARESFAAAVALQEDYAPAQFGLANACMRLGLEEEAREHRDAFQKLHRERLKTNQRHRQEYDDLRATCEDAAGILLDAGRVYLAEGDLAATEVVLTRAILLHPSEVSCRKALVALYLEQDRTAEAIQLLRELAELHPEQPTYVLQIARIYVGLQRFEDAEKILESLCESAPDDDAGYVALAGFYLQTTQKLPQALLLAKRAVELAPVADNYVLLSGVQERHQNWPEAIEAMSKAIQLEPDNLRYRQMHELLKQKMASTRNN